MKFEPLVSIVIPTYNSYKFLEKTLQSIINQTYKNIEIIVIDGGSKDKTLDIIKRFREKISYWISEKDRGQSNAINKGIRKAKGQIVTWIGSDDLFCRDTIEYIVNVFNKDKNIGIVYGDLIYIDEYDHEIKYVKFNELSVEYLLNVDQRVPQPGSFYRKEFWDKVDGLDENLHQVMDYDLFIKLLKISKGHYAKRPLAKFRVHKLSKSVYQGFYLSPLEGLKVSLKYKGKIISKNNYNRIKKLLKYFIKIIYYFISNKLFNHRWAINLITKKYVLKYLKKYSGSIILDLGCGENKYKKYFKDKNFIGIDYSDSFHNIKNVDIISNIYEIPLNNEYADTILLIQVLEHLNEPELAIKEINRLLKKDGNLILTTNFIWHTHEEPIDYFRYTHFGLKYLLTKNNFELEEIIIVTDEFTTLLLEVNYLLMKTVKMKLLKIILSPIILFYIHISQILVIIYNFFRDKKNKNVLDLINNSKNIPYIYYSHILVIAKKK